MIRLRLRLRRDRSGLRLRRDRSRLRSASFGEARLRLRPQGFGRIARLLTATAAMMIAGSSSVFACPVCFGAEETSMIDGTKLGILVLLGVTVTVQGAFVGFFLYLRQRAKRIAEADLDTEWSQLQGTSRAS